MSSFLWSCHLFVLQHIISAVFVALATCLPTLASSAASVSNKMSQLHDHAPMGSFESSDFVVILLTISVVLRVVNFHFFQIPSSVAMAFGAILITTVLLVLSNIPWLDITSTVNTMRVLLKDFPDLLLKFMLGFLLFASAIEVDLRNLGRIFSTVIALSVVSTLLSAVFVGSLTYLLMQNISKMDFSWCLLFGAIVSPTDPVTVMSILSDKPDLLPSSTKYFVIGESLLNDAVGVVLYLVLLEIVQQPDIGAFEIAMLLFETVFVECVCGAIIGVFLAWLAYSAIASVREPLLEVVITFVLVGNINMICRMVNASIPLASVGAGLFIGNYAVTFAMNDETSETFREIWKLADESLNSILFLLVGAADLFWHPQYLGWGRVILLVICTISISLAARFLSVALPLLSIILLEWLTGQRLRHRSVRYRGGTVAVLTWAGMRGGISIALALGVPDTFSQHAVAGHMTHGQLIFFMTFILVVFSILIQGLLFEPVIKMINRASFDIFSSGGLGTYVSSTSLGVSYADVGQTSEESFIEDHPIWETGGRQLYQDYDPDNDHLVRKESDLVLGDNYDELGSEDFNETADSEVEFEPSNKLPPRPRSHRSSSGSNRRMSANSFGHRDHGEYGGVQTSRSSPGVDHTRQESMTFQNLPLLGEPPSLTAFLGEQLRWRGN